MAKKKAVNKGGRPPVGDKPFDAKFIFELMSKQKVRWRKAARVKNITLAEFVRLAGDAYADQLLGPPSKP